MEKPGIKVRSKGLAVLILGLAVFWGASGRAEEAREKVVQVAPPAEIRLVKEVNSRDRVKAPPGEVRPQAEASKGDSQTGPKKTNPVGRTKCH